MAKLAVCLKASLSGCCENPNDNINFLFILNDASVCYKPIAVSSRAKSKGGKMLSGIFFGTIYDDEVGLSLFFST